MTATLINTRTLWRRSPFGAPDGAVSAPAARVENTNGAFQIGSEAERGRIYNNVDTPFTAADVGRLVTFRTTPPASASPAGSGTRRHENFTGRITAVDGGGAWATVEGFRASVAGTGVTYIIHASATFTVGTANTFPTDEGPLGGGGGPFPAVRTNNGPTVGRAIFFPTASDLQLRWLPWEISGRTSGTVVTISSPHPDAISTFPTASSLAWEMRDPPVFTPEDIGHAIHKAMLLCGWAIHHDRGKNDGAGAGRRIVWDRIYYSQGEDGQKELYARVLGGNNANGVGVGTSGQHGWDFSMISAYDRSFVNGGTNEGNGVNICRGGNATNNSWATSFDGANTNTNGPLWHPDMLNGSAIPDFLAWATPYHGTAASQFARENAKVTTRGGQLCTYNYAIFGDLDAMHIWFDLEGYGSSYVSFGQLAPRGQTPVTNWRLSWPVTNGTSVTLRIGGPGTANGENPASPSSGTAYAVGDRLQIVGQDVRAGITAETSHSGEFIESTTITALPGLLPAIGTVTTIAGASHVNGETLVINDGEGNTDTYEFRDDATPTGGNILVDTSGAPSATTMRDRLITAIGTGTVNITPSIGDTARVDLVHGTAGGVGNVSMTETVGDSGFVATGMGGGGYGITVANLSEDYLAGALVGEDPQPIYVSKFPHATNPWTSITNGSVRVGNRHAFSDATYHDVNSPTLVNSGFDMACRLEGADTNVSTSQPNQSSGHMGAHRVVVTDPNGDATRGYIPHFAIASARAGSGGVIANRAGEWYLALPSPFNDPDGDLAVTTLPPITMLLGPMPAAMARPA
jgi:hypothetical protein